MLQLLVVEWVNTNYAVGRRSPELQRFVACRSARWTERTDKLCAELGKSFGIHADSLQSSRSSRVTNFTSRIVPKRCMIRSPNFSPKCRNSGVGTSTYKTPRH